MKFGKLSEKTTNYVSYDNHAKLAVVVSSVPLCDRRFYLWPMESGDVVCEVAVVVLRLSS